MDARASRLLMSTRADKWAISYMPHWLRIQKIPGLSFRNSQTWTRVVTSFSSWGETARLNFKQHNKVTGRPTICPQFYSHGYSRQKEGADKGSDWKDEARGKAHWLGNSRFMLIVSPSCCKRQDGYLLYLIPLSFRKCTSKRRQVNNLANSLGWRSDINFSTLIINYQ